MLNGARARFTPEADALLVAVDASSVADFDDARDAIERHLDRFAFKEGALRYDWTER